MQTIAYRMLDDNVLLFMGGAAAPTVTEWQQYLHTLEQAAQRARQNSSLLRFLVFADEGVPNAKQRGAVVDLLRGVTTRIAVITTSNLARHLITVFGWLGLTLRGFAPNQLAAALEYLELPAERLPEIIALGSTLAPTIGGVSSFRDSAGTRDLAHPRA
jgi:hypothetical protein